MKKVKVVFDFISFPISGKVARGRTVISKMTQNPNFLSPDVSLDTMKNCTDELENRSLASKNGGKTETTRMHQSEEQWDDEMRKMACYDERVANNDPAIILSAGITISKQPSPYQRP